MDEDFEASERVYNEVPGFFDEPPSQQELDNSNQQQQQQQTKF